MRPLTHFAGSTLALAILLGAPALSAADTPETTAQPAETPLSPAIEQLRHAEGDWDVITENLRPDGSVARSMKGSYEFSWVVPDRVLSGRSIQPELGQVSALLFYYEETANLIGMASVGPDGHLWVMTGPADGEVRTTPPTPMPGGNTIQLRFTRYNVEPDRFESKMEVTSDGGATWTEANHQILTRQETTPVGG